MNIAFLFSDQSAHYPGIGKDIYEHFSLARDIYRKVAEVTGIDVVDVSFYGPPQLMRSSKNAHTCLLALEMSIVNILASRQLRPDIAAGFSFGEYPALMTAGGLSFDDGVRTVFARGSLMSESAAQKDGAMALIDGLSRDALEKIMRQRGKQVSLASMNTDSQFLVAGERGNIAHLAELAKERGAASLLLPVEGAFHSPFHEDASIAFQERLRDISFKPLRFPVIGNVQASVLSTPEEIYADVSAQLVSPVQWHTTILRMLESGVTTFVEVGPGHGLTGMVKKISSTAELLITRNVEELHRTIERLTEILYAPSRTRRLVHQPELGTLSLPNDRVPLRMAGEDDVVQKTKARLEVLQKRDDASPKQPKSS